MAPLCASHLPRRPWVAASPPLSMAPPAPLRIPSRGTSRSPQPTLQMQNSRQRRQRRRRQGPAAWLTPCLQQWPQPWRRHGSGSPALASQWCSLQAALPCLAAAALLPGARAWQKPSRQRCEQPSSSEAAPPPLAAEPPRKRRHGRPGARKHWHTCWQSCRRRRQRGFRPAAARAAAGQEAVPCLSWRSQWSNPSAS